MDIFEDVGLTSQVHDFNPGVAESGLFWTKAIDRGSVRVDMAAGSASLHVADLDVEDYHDVVNALMDGPSVEAAVSFDVTWSGVTDRVKFRNTNLKFVGEYAHNTAVLVWSGEEEHFNFRSVPHTSGFAEIGHERNGVFFH